LHRDARGRRVVLGAYVILIVPVLAVAAASEAFWQPAHSTAPVAALAALILVAALVSGRRWA
jgi:hypothetical protein